MKKLDQAKSRLKDLYQNNKNNEISMIQEQTNETFETNNSERNDM